MVGDFSGNAYDPNGCLTKLKTKELDNLLNYLDIYILAATSRRTIINNQSAVKT
jgi:hypothetical protein